MIVLVRPATASLIFASTTANVPSALTDERALIEQVVELQRDALAVRFGQAEANRPERRRQERRVHRRSRSQPRSTPLSSSCCSAHRPEMSAFASSSADDVVLQRLPHGRRRRATWCGPRPCISSCIRMWVKNASKRDLRPIRGAERDCRDRHQHLLELRVLHVLQHHALGALFLDDAVVVRQVERGRLHAAVAVAGRRRPR